MLKAGLTGGLACGKSFVAETLAALGCHVIEADRVGHQVMEPGGEAYDGVVAAFGQGILDADGKINRLKLAEHVFPIPAELEKLNAIVHPAVRARALHQFQELEERHPQGILVYVAAILIEAGAHREVDKIIVVSCAREQQIERAIQRPGASETGVRARLDRQMPLKKKKELADYIIDTSGTKDDTVRQTEIVYQDLLKLSSSY